MARATSRRKKKPAKQEAHDSRSGQKKTNLTTKEPAVSGARKPSSAREPASTKRKVRRTGRVGAASAGRKPRAAADAATRRTSSKQSTVGRRPPRPRAAQGGPAKK